MMTAEPLVVKELNESLDDSPKCEKPGNTCPHEAKWRFKFNCNKGPTYLCCEACRLEILSITYNTIRYFGNMACTGCADTITEPLDHWTFIKL